MCLKCSDAVVHASTTQTQVGAATNQSFCVCDPGYSGPAGGPCHPSELLLDVTESQPSFLDPAGSQTWVMYAQSNGGDGSFGNNEDAIFTNLSVRLGGAECTNIKWFSKTVSMCTTPSFLLTDRDAVNVHAVFERLGAVSSFPIPVKGAPAPVNTVSAQLHCSLKSCCGSVSLHWNRQSSAIR